MLNLVGMGAEVGRDLIHVARLTQAPTTGRLAATGWADRASLWATVQALLAYGTAVRLHRGWSPLVLPPPPRESVKATASVTRSLQSSAVSATQSVTQAALAPPAADWSPAVREAGFWAAHLMFWGVVFALLLLVQAVNRPDHSEPSVILAARVVTCLVATAAIRRLANMPQLLERLNATRAGLVAGGLLTFAVGITLAFGVVDGVFTGAAGEMPRSRLTVDLADQYHAACELVCGLYFGIQLIQERSTAQFRAVEAEAAALRTELHRLQSQISPHFLFNALNTVLASRDDPAAIETITQALANYLRFLLRPAAPLEPLGRELDAIEQYLTVQSVRFGAGLVTEIDCEEQVRGLLVPPVMVQPLVENALKYGGGPDGKGQAGGRDGPAGR